jgi:hypothetical protein
MRTSLIALLFPLIMAAATPADDVHDMALRSLYHAQAQALCLVGMEQRRPGSFEPGDGARGCRCTVDLFMTGKSLAQLPPLDAANFRTIMKNELGQCLDRMATSVAKRQVSEPAGAEPAAAPEATPAANAAPAATVAGRSSPTGAGMAAWLATVPLWLWGAIAFAFLLSAVRRLSRRNERRDLLGVPPSMRSGPLGQPKRPDLP